MSRRTAVCALAGAALLASACGGGQHGHPGAPTSGRATSAAAEATPAPGALLPGAARQREAARYLAIARPANRRLSHDFDAGLDGKDRGNLAAARSDLRDAAATERGFDRRLLELRLAPATDAMARILVTANQSRARLTDAAARAGSLVQLHAFARRLDAANAPVEVAVRVIRAELGLPPPKTS